MSLFIIFGTSNRKKNLGAGEFFCPHCNTQRPYTHRKAVPNISLFFVPLVPIGEGQEYIECDVCGNAFAMQVLDYRPTAATNSQQETPKSIAALMNNAEAILKAGTPAEFLIRDMNQAGIEREVAQTVVNSYNISKQCESCSLTYHANIENCRECNTTLTQPA